ncbi:MAG: thioredoxin family protein [Planctomycetales bacterium]|nr:thioredoxin family protein [Planctomycetales bacterium]
MVQVALALIMAVTGEGKSEYLSYEDAFAKAQKENKPLLILVGARWCASCQVMKRDTLVPMMDSGELKDIVVTVVDKDERPELCEQLMHGPTLPQVVMYTRSSGNWKRLSLTGMQSRNRMVELLTRVAEVSDAVMQRPLVR